MILLSNRKMFSGELLAKPLDKGKAKLCSFRCWVGAACRLLWFSDWAEFVLQSRLSLVHLRWTLMCITNSSMYTGLLSGCIDTASEVIISFHIPVVSLISVKQLLSPFSKNLIVSIMLYYPCSKCWSAPSPLWKLDFIVKLPLKRLYLFCSLYKVLWSRYSP